MRESRSPPPFNEEPQISKDFWGFFVFSSRRSFSSQLGLFSTPGVLLHRIFSSSGFFFIGFHGWIGRQSCLSDYSRISADIWPLANGSRQKWAPIFFTQISQMTQIFSHWLFKSHRFHRFTQIFSHWLFKSHRFHGLTQIFFIDYFSHGDLHRFSLIFFFFLSFLYFADFRPVGLGGWRRFLISWTRKGLCRFF